MTFLVSLVHLILKICYCFINFSPLCLISISRADLIDFENIPRTSEAHSLYVFVDKPSAVSFVSNRIFILEHQESNLFEIQEALKVLLKRNYSVHEVINIDLILGFFNFLFDLVHGGTTLWGAKHKYDLRYHILDKSEEVESKLFGLTWSPILLI